MILQNLIFKSIEFDAFKKMKLEVTIGRKKFGCRGYFVGLSIVSIGYLI
ncbi:hypothetical protein MTBBW1_1890025 [Desulfamplus magnetovallimortis]|uniref:Uncharacterized protein n=1 Tax=Desulfamplus magnetovallimortis TaxID=1246637 RepID=A0A1W1HAX1_9BACT|nr:hypothetical protein [Desulfamplus magnetovallimortis]SLM29627.1 hypothetical protein MTBBW1_1890025 [Desulfamplus magnetovallimortis]